MGSLPVYEIQPENRNGPCRTLHRNLLLPCNFLPMENPVLPPVHSPTPRLTPGQEQDLVRDDHSDSSDTEEEIAQDMNPGNTTPNSDQESQPSTTTPAKGVIPGRQRPKRRRRPPRNMTYDTPGNPGFHQPSVNTCASSSSPPSFIPLALAHMTMRGIPNNVHNVPLSPYTFGQSYRIPACAVPQPINPYLPLHLQWIVGWVMPQSTQPYMFTQPNWVCPWATPVSHSG